jgi:ATP-dependent protease ClpP protease subunit
MLDSQIDSIGEVDEINVYINSGGGYTVDGYAIHDRLASLPCVINTIANGMVASIATVIFQAPKTQNKGGERRLYKNSEPFIHNPHWQPNENSGSIESKDALDLFESLKREEAKLANFYVGATGLDSVKVASIMNDAKQLTPQEFIDFGFADMIINTDIQSFTKYKMVAYLNNDKQTEMENKELKSELGTIKGFMAKIVKALFKNAYTETVDGTKIYFDGTMVTKDTAVFSDESMTTPLPDGDYTLDSIILTVVNGIVTEVTDPQPADNNTPDALAEAQKEIDALKAQLAEKENVVAEKENVINETKVEIVALAKKVTEFEAMLVTGGNFQANGGQSNGKDKGEIKEPTALEKVVAMRKEKANANAKK